MRNFIYSIFLYLLKSLYHGKEAKLPFLTSSAYLWKMNLVNCYLSYTDCYTISNCIFYLFLIAILTH